MAIRLRTFLQFLHLLLLQEMIVTFGEAAVCHSPSRLFRGACLSNRNCGQICTKEGFVTGRCKFFKCICSKDCNAGGGGGGGGGGEGGGGGSGGGGGGGGGDGDGGPPSDGPPEGGEGQ